MSSTIDEVAKGSKRVMDALEARKKYSELIASIEEPAKKQQHEKLRQLLAEFVKQHLDEDTEELVEPEKKIETEIEISVKDLEKLIKEMHKTFDKEDVREIFSSKDLDKELTSIKKEMEKINEIIIKIDRNHLPPEHKEEYETAINTILARIKEVLLHEADKSTTWYLIVMKTASIMMDVIFLFDIIWKHNPDTKKRLTEHCKNTTEQIIKECIDLGLVGPAKVELEKLEKQLEELKNPPQPKAPEESRTAAVLQSSDIGSRPTTQYDVGTRNGTLIRNNDGHTQVYAIGSMDTLTPYSLGTRCTDNTCFKARNNEKLYTVEELLNYMKGNSTEYEKEFEHYTKWIEGSHNLRGLAELLRKKYNDGQLGDSHKFSEAVRAYFTA